jgi:cholesterol oxidase
LKIALPDGSVWPQDKKTGFFDFTLSNNIFLWKGCGLGGGSLVNSSISIRPDPRIYASWPQPFSDDQTTLDSYFDLAESVLCPNPVRYFVLSLLDETHS